MRREGEFPDKKHACDAARRVRRRKDGRVLPRAGPPPAAPRAGAASPECAISAVALKLPATVNCMLDCPLHNHTRQYGQAWGCRG